MPYFEDLSPHTFCRTIEFSLLNIGWLDREQPFATGETPAEFQNALAELCRRPVCLCRGFHTCNLCPGEGLHKQWPPKHLERFGNGQIHVLGPNQVWYAAPTMIHHYVIEHRYCPPDEFIDAVLRPLAIGIDLDRFRPISDGAADAH